MHNVAVVLVVLVGCVPARESPPPENAVPIVARTSDSKVEASARSTDAATSAPTSNDGSASEDAAAAFTAFTAELAIAVDAAKRASAATSVTGVKSELEKVVACLAAPTVHAAAAPCPHVDTVIRSLASDLQDAAAAISPQADRDIVLNAARAGMAAKDLLTARKHAAIAYTRLARLSALAEADEFGMFGLLRTGADGGVH